MIDVLNRHCRPDSVANAFTTLMSLFNDVQGDTEPIMEFRSRFEGMVVDMSRCKVIIPPLLLIMIFICALHSRYSDILDQFHSRYKDLEAATIESFVVDVTYHDGFWIVDPRKNSHQGGPKFLMLPPIRPAKHGPIHLNGFLPFCQDHQDSLGPCHCRYGHLSHLSPH